jgi:hypothetical protein
VKKISRWLLLLLGVFLIVAIGLIFFTWISVNRYLDSSAFRAFVSEKTSSLLGAPGEFLPLHWSGFSVQSDGFSAEGDTSSPLQQMRVDQIRAEVNFRALINRIAQVDLLAMEKVSLQLRAKTSGARLTVPPPAGPPPREGLLALFAPNNFLLKHATVRSLDVSWTGSERGPGAVRGTQLQATPEGAAINFIAQGGQVEQQGLPTFEISRVKACLRNPELFITEALLLYPGQGSLVLTGEAGWDTADHLDLRLDLKEIPITPFLPEDWRARLTGLLVGDTHLTRDPQHPLHADGRIHLQDGKLEALPVLEKVAFLTQTREFRSFKIHRATGEFQWTEQSLEIRHIVVESQGLLKIEGDIRTDGPNLTGLLEVGVTPKALNLIPGARSQVFTREQDGYVWTTLKLSGTVQDPQEDLSGRLQLAVLQATGETVIEGAKTLKKGAESIWDGVISVLPLR